MKDIPVFATDNGVASLTLKEIPYTQTGYIKLRDTLEPEKLLADCVRFCKMAGAEAVYASGHDFLEAYPFHTAIWRMARTRDGLSDTDTALFPVTEQTLGDWRELYNRRMAQVPNFSYMTQADAERMLRQGNGYFVHREETLLGIGMASGDRIDAVVSAQRGAGEQIVLALNHALSGAEICLEVASANSRAVRLYERLGFTVVQEISRWYEVCKKT